MFPGYEVVDRRRADAGFEVGEREAGKPGISGEAVSSSSKAALNRDARSQMSSMTSGHDMRPIPTRPLRDIAVMLSADPASIGPKGYSAVRRAPIMYSCVCGPGIFDRIK